MTPAEPLKKVKGAGIAEAQNTETKDKTKTKIERIRLWIMAAGLLISSGALVCAAYGINQQHEWYRRHFAAEMIREWNQQSSSHKAEIENAYPGLFRAEGPRQSRPRIDHDEARLIYFSVETDGSAGFTNSEPSNGTSNPTRTVSTNGPTDPSKIVDPKRWKTRNHCIALLNYFEFVASAWENQVADRKMIEDSFKKTILRWHHDLEEFMSVMKATRQYEPWPPLQRVVSKWKADDANFEEVKPTGTTGS